MSSTPKYAHCDTRKPNGFYVQFERVIADDDTQDRPDDKDCGFWPSKDPEAAGYVQPSRFLEAQRAAKERMAAYDRGEWNFIGIRARAKCCIVSNGVGTFINLESPGLWGTESDSDETYLNEIYGQEIKTLKGMIADMRDPVYEEG